MIKEQTDPDIVKLFRISHEGEENHGIGDERCDECWPRYYPRQCACGGLIHAEFGDEDYEGDYWVYRKCDQCGDDYEEAT